MPYKMILSAAGITVLALAVFKLLKTGSSERGDFVDQAALTRINTEYHDVP